MLGVISAMFHQTAVLTQPMVITPTTLWISLAASCPPSNRIRVSPDPSWKGAALTKRMELAAGAEKPLATAMPATGDSTSWRATSSETGPGKRIVNSVTRGSDEFQTASTLTSVPSGNWTVLPSNRAIRESPETWRVHLWPGPC